MSNHNVWAPYLDKLALHRCDDEGRAGLCLASVPWPRGLDSGVSLAGRSTYRQSLGQWPGEHRAAPRRLLLAADGGDAPPVLTLTTGEVPPSGIPPVADMLRVAESPDFYFFWESHAIRMTWGGRSVELIMGLRTGGRVHWWQAARLAVREETPFCRVIEAGGAIPLRPTTLNDMRDYPGFNNPFLHKHNWLNAHVVARLHANGVCEVFARHINSKFFDDGLPLPDAVPVIGLRTTRMTAAPSGPWDGRQTRLDLGEATFDLTDAAPLVTPQKPGAFEREGDFLVWQPYRGMELYGGPPTREITGDAYICRAEDRIIPRGMARTVRFSFSLAPDRPARVARYLPPAWWFGVCEEFLPQSVLPISNEYDASLKTAADWQHTWSVNGGFDDGSVARYEGRDADHRFEPGWEGEVPYAQLLYAWRTGDPREYDQALRSAYFFTDVCVDHAAQAVRMHGFPPNAFSVPMARVQACIAAWLETGDPYPLATARAVIETAYWVHKNSWPRLAVGRDACFTRGAVMLYRYLNEDRYRVIARDALGDTIAAQNPDGSFSDQGGGAGIHQWAAYIVKPWMGLMATNGMIDYLELFPADAELLASVRCFGEWLLRERRAADNGIIGWGYQHMFRGGRTFMNFASGHIDPLPTPAPWHKEYLARFLMFCALRFDRREYFEAWETSYRGNRNQMHTDHDYSQALQFIPWLQAKLWQVAVTPEGLHARPAWLGPKTPRSAVALGPEGPIPLSWLAPDQPAAATDTHIDFAPAKIGD